MQCLVDYTLHFDTNTTLSCDTLYVVGGLYGNAKALEASKHIIEPEDLVIFNGDIHWFDASVELFVRFKAPRVLRHVRIGNV